MSKAAAALAPKRSNGTKKTNSYLDELTASKPIPPPMVIISSPDYPVISIDGTSRPLPASAQPESSTSKRPKPVITSRQPQTINVQTTGDNKYYDLDGKSKSSGSTDQDILRESLEKRAATQRLTLKWMEELLEPEVDVKTFKEACQHLSLSSYLEAIHERHLSDQCSYPLCLNPPTAPYEANASRVRIIRRGNTKTMVADPEGNRDEGFCSVVCRERSQWVQAIGLHRGSDEEVMDDWELKEEYEVRIASEQRQAEEERLKSTTTSPSNTTSLVLLPSLASKRTASPTKQEPISSMKSLIDSLTIHERPLKETSSIVPVAPTLPPVDSDDEDSSRYSFNFSKKPKSTTPPALTAAIPELIPTSKQSAHLKESLRRSQYYSSAQSLLPSGADEFKNKLGIMTKGPSRKFKVTKKEAEQAAAGTDDYEDDDDDDVAEDEPAVTEEEMKVWTEMALAQEELRGLVSG